MTANLENSAEATGLEKVSFIQFQRKAMPKTRDLFKKIQDTKGTFHPKMDSIKDRNGMDLTEAEDIKKRWSGVPLPSPKNTQKNYTKKIFMTQITMMV